VDLIEKIAITAVAAVLFIDGYGCIYNGFGWF